MTIQQAGALLRGGKTSAAELTGESLRRIAQEQPRLNAFITVMEEQAPARAAHG